jgi:predicted polyphosphate/ATP-dependent NAD kinase
MNSVGVIANPASGKDIRRLVAHGTVFNNNEKVNIVRRLLLGLEATGVKRAWIMPDSFCIGKKALDGLDLGFDASILPMPATFSCEDSTQASARMVAEHVNCIVTLGGDGTNRAVAKASGDVPLMPISTGTNNVFPTMVEGTVAGIAAGLVACGLANEAVHKVPRLDIFCVDSRQAGHSDVPDDIALVDAAIYDEQFIASRAIWDASKIKAVISTSAKAGTIGLSSIGAHILGENGSSERGLYLRLEPGGQEVLAPIAPGLIRRVSLAEYRLLSPSEEVILVRREPCVLALDGEREIELKADAAVRVRFNLNGPNVINARRAIEVAAKAGIFVQEAARPA